MRKNRQKNGFCFGQNSIFEPIFTFFFKKIELFRRKTVRINIFPGRNKKFSQKPKRQAHFGKKWVKRSSLHIRVHSIDEIPAIEF